MFPKHINAVINEKQPPTPRELNRGSHSTRGISLHSLSCSCRQPMNWAPDLTGPQHCVSYHEPPVNKARLPAPTTMNEVSSKKMATALHHPGLRDQSTQRVELR